MRKIKSIEGQLYVAGDGALKRFDGDAWFDVGVNFDGTIHDVQQVNGDIIVVGEMDSGIQNYEGTGNLAMVENDSLFTWMPSMPGTGESRLNNIYISGFDLYVTGSRKYPGPPDLLTFKLEGQEWVQQSFFSMSGIEVIDDRQFIALSGNTADNTHLTYELCSLFELDPHREPLAHLENGWIDVFETPNPVIAYDHTISLPGYGIKQSPDSLLEDRLATIYSAGLWWSGESIGQAYTSATMFGIEDVDDIHRIQGFGPISQWYDQSYIRRYNSVWSLTKEEIEYHQAHFEDPGYFPIKAIYSYPGNGRVEYGESEHLLPFVHVDEDGHYDPFQGDYPSLSGDRSLFMIISDGHEGLVLGKPEVKDAIQWQVRD